MWLPNILCCESRIKQLVIWQQSKWLIVIVIFQTNMSKIQNIHFEVSSLISPWLNYPSQAMTKTYFGESSLSQQNAFWLSIGSSSPVAVPTLSRQCSMKCKGHFHLTPLHQTSRIMASVSLLKVGPATPLSRPASACISITLSLLLRHKSV